MKMRVVLSLLAVLLAVSIVGCNRGIPQQPELTPAVRTPDCLYIPKPGSEPGTGYMKFTGDRAFLGGFYVLPEYWGYDFLEQEVFPGEASLNTKKPRRIPLGSLDGFCWSGNWGFASVDGLYVAQTPPYLHS